MVKERKGSVQAPKQVIATDVLPLTGLGITLEDRPDGTTWRQG